jgi:Acetyltransferase (GNAT) domain
MAIIATREQLGSISAWKNAFSDERKEWRYYEIVNDTISEPAAEHRYLLLQSGAVQPVFIIDQDLLAGSGAALQAFANAVRRVWPRFLKMRTLMIGCAAGEGHLADLSSVYELASALPKIAKDFRAPLIVMKEFPSRYRAALDPLRANGFTRVPSMPMTRLNIMYDNFDDFLARKLSKATRKSLRRKLRAADSAAPPIELQVVSDVSPFVDEVYPLYLAVYERSPLHFEKLTKEFLRALGTRMPDRVRFFIWRQGGKAIAFSLCMLNDDSIYDEYLGLDYSVAFDLHLYFYTLRDIINWAIAHGIKWYVSSALNYEPKLHLRCELVPLDLYVKHTSPVINVVMKRVLPLLEPTRNDPVLHRFPNFSEVWD